MSSFDDDTWERQLFAQRALNDGARPLLTLDVSDVLARIDARSRRARVFDVARVVTLANMVAAAAACLALMRGAAPQSNAASLDGASEGATNMTPIARVLDDSASALACRMEDGMPGGPMCIVSAATFSSVGDIGTSSPSSSSSSSMTTASLDVESLACVDEVTCGVVGP